VNCPIYDFNECEMIAFDMDSNLIDTETIDEFTKATGIIGKVEEITKKEIGKNLDFKQALAEWVRIIRELPLEKNPYAVHKIHIMPVVAELILYFKSKGYKDTMIFGGFTISTMEAGKALNNNLVVTNELLVENGFLKNKVVSPVTQRDPIGVFEGSILFSRVRPKRDVVVRESANDAHIFERAVFAGAFNPKYIMGICCCGRYEKISNLLSLFFKSLSYQFCNQAQNVDI
jgi:phosphoserine phosphatase